MPTSRIEGNMMRSVTGFGFRLLLSIVLMPRNLCAQTTAPVESSISVSKDFDCASDVTFEVPEPDHIVVTLGDMVNFDGWLFRLDGVAGKTVRIDFKANRKMNKWKTLNPVFAPATDFGDLAAYADGKNDKTAKATNGVTVPEAVSQNWRYMTNTKLVSNTLFTVTQTFTDNSVWIANRVPYTAAFNEKYVRSLRDNPLAKVIHIGESHNHHPLIAVQIGADPSTHPTVVIAGGEQAIQFDSMWCTQGAIEFLLGNTEAAKSLREQCCFLIIPMLDPDGVIRNHMNIVGAFTSDAHSESAIAWANFFQQWVNSGRRLDVVLEMHNVQSLEAPHLSRAYIENEKGRGPLADALNEAVVKRFRMTRLDYSPAIQVDSLMATRFGGWLTHNFGPILIIYEINAQAPVRHLDLPELQNTGGLFAMAAGEFLSSDAGQSLLKMVDEIRSKRKVNYVDNPATQPAKNAIEDEALLKANPRANEGL